MDFATQVLSHSLLVEAAEDHFTPLCIYNNTKGDHDAEIREAFREPSWNNPVVRFVDGKRKQLAPKVHNRWTIAAVTEGMIKALESSKRPVPEYLRLLHAQEATRTPETAIFGMG